MTVAAPLILNVDDNDGARYAKTRVLVHAGFEVIEAATGQGALDQVRAHNPALVLLDVKLPDISGIEVCSILKRDPQTRSTLILQTSAAAVQSFDKVRALDGGADSYLTEPIEPAELAANVRALLRLHRAEEALRDADRRKDQFLATLAHELRNPLAPIRNAVELMDPRHHASEDTVRDARMIARRQVEHLSRLVDDLLDVSRITHGKIALQMECVDLGAAVATAVEANQPSIQKKQHTLHVNVPDESCMIYGDPIRVAQVISNLLSNAAKYTPEGGVIELDASAAEGTMTIRVRDNGIGIPPNELADVFNLFMQSEDSLARSEGGLGIGLSLAKTLTELHGGSIEAFSAGLGMGSEFVVTLPIAASGKVAASWPAASGAVTSGEDASTNPAPAAANPVGDTQGAPDAKRRVMVVDDSVDGAESMSILLEMLGHDVRVMYDGAAAISTAGEFKPEVVLLDIGLPGIDGYQVARALRAEPATAGALLIALTGYGQESDRQRTRDAGFDHHLVKPASLDDIERVIATDGASGMPRNPGTPVQSDATG
ncbi:Chemotaxis protein methyltransferase CheR [Paraburkholderia caribensis MBA4]|uniref:histidine kinase n=1 Tax=Paraburkholderia caribensis MBA4 TaxID=1323664 RepID=A0A0P0R4Y4_9BURK|nr:response regulator [Paraburkholderia caribensis]ALL63335.1 Chemotaxis protein methyltransferase CheR [Paraburkholderia caribensis MBA4]